MQRSASRQEHQAAATGRWLTCCCPSSLQAIRGLFGADASQEEAVDKLEQLQDSIRLVKALFRDQQATEVGRSCRVGFTAGSRGRLRMCQLAGRGQVMGCLGCAPPSAWCAAQAGEAGAFCCKP